MISPIYIRLNTEVIVINPFLLVSLVVVIAVGLVVFKRTGNKKRAAIAAAITLVLVWGLALVADLFME